MVGLVRKRKQEEQSGGRRGRLKGYLQETSRSSGSCEAVEELRWRWTMASGGGDIQIRREDLGRFQRRSGQTGVSSSKATCNSC